MTHISLFAGIGGIDLAAEWARFRTIAQVECDPYCLAVLACHWPDVPRCDDIHKFPDRDYGAITLISGGFPCQPFSACGKRRGRSDDRHLWPEMLRVIRAIGPQFVLAENVPGLFAIESGMAFETVLTDLEAAGYETWAGVIPAAGVGASHLRYRVFIVGHAGRAGRQQESRGAHGDEGADEGRPAIQADQLTSASADVADTKRQHEARPISQGDSGGRPQKTPRNGGDATDTRLFGQTKCEEQSARIEQSDWWSTEPDVGRVAHGIPSRVDRLRCLGNAVVPQQAYPILQAIVEVEVSIKYESFRKEEGKA